MKTKMKMLYENNKNDLRGLIIIMHENINDGVFRLWLYHMNSNVPI